MKRMITAILSLTLALSLASCGNSDSTTGQYETSEGLSQSATNAPSPSSTAQDTDSKTGNVLVVYYSATGNTEEVAGYIASATNGTLFEVKPADDYTSEDLNWSDRNSRVSREYANPELRNMELVSATVKNWESYDTIFIGYPIWWGIAAWPLDTFIKTNDFAGKTVIPFCTSSSSGLGDSGRLLAEMAGEGNWQEGIRFQSGVSEDTVLEWLNGLSL